MDINDFKIPSLKERYIKLIADRVTISIEDLTESEKGIIDESFELFQEKMDDLKIANDEVKRLTIELANYKAMYSNKSGRFNDDYDTNDLRDK
jgi:hypothetical protein